MLVDWRNPDYAAIGRERLFTLRRLRDNPGSVDAMKAHYRAHPADFISDWGVTFDPRNAELERPTVVPFILFPRQREWIDWVVGRWRSQSPGLCEKSRDMGISWLATATACTLCLFNEGLSIGFGSRVVDLVDKIGTMKPLLPKARMFMEHLPEEFRGGWLPWRDAPYMRLNFPETGSLIMGEGGDQIGRGDRASIYFVDEAAYLERAELVEHSLSQTTNCRIDMSSVRHNTVFARKAREGKVDKFVFDWRDDPRKDEFWYRALELPSNQFIERPDGTKVNGKGLDPVTIAQEVDRDYTASVEGVLIPSPWVRSAVGALRKLGIAKTGARTLSLDVADEGRDFNGLAGRTGVEIDYLNQWTGKGGDIFRTTEQAFGICDELGVRRLRYDADGLGAGVRGDARVINERRAASGRKAVAVEGYRGSAGVYKPEAIVEGTLGRDSDKGRTNEDYFANRKAQSWWKIRRAFQRTHRWVTDGIRCSPDEIISIDEKLPPSLLHKLTDELSQPTYSENTAGKILVDKTPDNLPSPNLADAVVIDYADNEPPPMEISSSLLAQVRASGRRRAR